MLLHPTPAGKKLLREVTSCWHELFERYSAQVGAKKGEQLAKELCRVAAALSEE